MQTKEEKLKVIDSKWWDAVVALRAAQAELDDLKQRHSAAEKDIIFSEEPYEQKREKYIDCNTSFLAAEKKLQRNIFTLNAQARLLEDLLKGIVIDDNITGDVFRSNAPNWVKSNMIG